MIRVAAISDLHGYLPNPSEIGNRDIVVIAGDIFPLSIDHDWRSCPELCKEWFLDVFLVWVSELDVDKVFLTPGNHDFFFMHYPQYFTAQDTWYCDNENVKKLVGDKFVFLLDTAYEYNGAIIYGTPWCENLSNWAFYAKDTYEKYNKMPNRVDLLISHMPPRVEKVGCSYPNTVNERNFGSENLKKIIEEKNISGLVCGHIHTGTHGGVEYCGTMIYNVSIKDESYANKYNITNLILT